MAGLKVLGQATPSTTLTDLYTVPALKETVVSSIVVCNIDIANPKTFRIAIRPLGATIANKHYNYYNSTIGVAATVPIVIGITLATTDVISVYGSDTNVQFSAYGHERTA